MTNALSLAAIFAMVATPAAAADQFNLHCRLGKTELSYRVDLLRKEACVGACEHVWKIGSVTTGELTLVDTLANYPTEIPQTVTVNRQTGAYHHWIDGGREAITEDGECTPAPFTGFPASKF